MKPRTLLIGLDGATFTLLDHLTAKNAGSMEAVMPFLASVYKNGTRSVLQSTPNPLTPPAWVSLMTGRTPGQHGIFDFIRAEERSRDVFFTLYDARDCRAEMIWSIASMSGKKIAALNFPFTAPPDRNINGILVPGFVPWRHLKINTHPREFYDRLKTLDWFNAKQLAWDFELEKNAVNELSDDECEAWIRYHIPREKQWFEMAAHVLEHDQPDLMAVMFDGVDKLQHQAWAFLLPELADTVADRSYYNKMRQLCLEYFGNLDSFMERLFNLSGSATRLFIASDHGFTTCREVVRINTYLEQKGYLKWKEMPDTPEAARREESMFANMDWDNTTAYCRTPSSNGISIRVASLAGDSGISPTKYQSFRQQLIEELEGLRDPEDNKPVISHIYTREEVFSGPCMKDAPDLLLELRDHGFVSIKNRHPVIEKRKQLVGTHHPDGIFLAMGQGVRKGEITGRHHITDVCATLLYSLGLPVPEDMEGKPAVDFFTDDHIAEYPIHFNSMTHKRTSGNTESPDMMENEKDRLMAQLKMLGYME